VVPKHFFVRAIIERRNPLAATARRAGWIGSNILLDQVPDAGKIFWFRTECLYRRTTSFRNGKRRFS